MIRTQIQLSESAADKLRRMADEQHASMAELIRRAIALLFEASSAHDADERYARAAAAAGACASGHADLSSEHDKHFAETCRA
jgi:Arc/MetJ-type ribon-helix-helix transcriptional regulator